MKKSKKIVPLALATSLVSVPFFSIPSAYAVSNVYVDADDSDVAGDDSDYTITFTLDDDLNAGDTITLTFDSDFDISSGIDTSDVEVNGYEPRKVKYNSSKNSITITVDDDYDADDEIEVVIKNRITNPSDSGDYDVDVETSGDSDSDYGTIEIVDDKSSSSSSSTNAFSVSVGSDQSGEETSYKLGKIDLGSKKLSKGSWVTVTFPDSDMVPSSIKTSNVEINGYSVSDIDISGKSVDLKIPSGADGDDTLQITFLSGAGITNPSADSNYVIKVKISSKTYESKKFDIGGSSSGSSNLSVALSDSTPGARPTFTIQGDFGSKKLTSDSDIRIDFPSNASVPLVLSPSEFTINGDTAKRAVASGNSIYLTTPSDFSSSSDVKVVISNLSFVTNPITEGDYTLKATVDGKTITSDKFTISRGTSATTPTPTPATANNSAATVTLTNTALNAATGVTVGIKAMGQPINKDNDFIEIVFPVGYKIPAFIQPSSITVNSVPASYVSVRGQNVLVYPATNLVTNAPISISIKPTANIVNPGTKSTYSISVYTSREQAPLFSRLVGVGGAVVPATTPAPTPTPQTSTAIPANAALVKINVASFTLQGKSYPLTAAPYLGANSTTIVPAQFFKEALALTTTWNNEMVSIVSASTLLKFTVGSNIATVGSQQFTMPAKVELKNGMPMIPLKFVNEQLGYKTGWDGATSSAYVYK